MYSSNEVVGEIEGADVGIGGVAGGFVSGEIFYLVVRDVQTGEGQRPNVIKGIKVEVC